MNAQSQFKKFFGHARARIVLMNGFEPVERHAQCLPTSCILATFVSSINQIEVMILIISYFDYAHNPRYTHSLYYFVPLSQASKSRLANFYECNSAYFSLSCDSIKVLCVFNWSQPRGTVREITNASPCSIRLIRFVWIINSSTSRTDFIRASISVCLQYAAGIKLKRRIFLESVKPILTWPFSVPAEWTILGIPLLCKLG